MKLILILNFGEKRGYIPSCCSENKTILLFDIVIQFTYSLVIAKWKIKNTTTFFYYGISVLILLRKNTLRKQFQ